MVEHAFFRPWRSGGKANEADVRKTYESSQRRNVESSGNLTWSSASGKENLGDCLRRHENVIFEGIKLDHTATGVVAASSFSNSERYQLSAWAARPGIAVLPQMSDRVRRVSGLVFVRWASLTAFAHGPSSSKRQ